MNPVASSDVDWAIAAIVISTTVLSKFIAKIKNQISFQPNKNYQTGAQMDSSWKLG